MKKLIILNFNTGECLIEIITEERANKIRDYETYIVEEYQFDIDNIQWMLTSEPIININ